MANMRESPNIRVNVVLFWPHISFCHFTYFGIHTPKSDFPPQFFFPLRFGAKGAGAKIPLQNYPQIVGAGSLKKACLLVTIHHPGIWLWTLTPSITCCVTTLAIVSPKPSLTTHYADVEVDADCTEDTPPKRARQAHTEQPQPHQHPPSNSSLNTSHSPRLPADRATRTSRMSPTTCPPTKLQYN